MKRLLAILMSIVMLFTAVYAAPLAAEAATVGKVSSIKVTKKTYNTVSIKWSKVKGATGYQVYQSTSKNKGFKKVKTIKKGKTVSAKITKLKAKKTYYFKVRAVKKKKLGKFSKVISAKTKSEPWGLIKGVSVKEYNVADYYSWDDEEGGGFACFTVDFKAVKGAKGYQVKYYYEDSEDTVKTIQKNCFACGTQDVLPTLKVRAYKTNKEGKRVYGPWKTINTSKPKSGGLYYLEDFETKIEDVYPMLF